MIVFLWRFKYILRLITIGGDNIPVVGILYENTILIRRFRESLGTRVEQDVTIHVFTNNNFKGEKDKTRLFIDLLSYYVELLVGKLDWDLDAIDLILLTRPVVIKPPPVILSLACVDHFLKLLWRLLTRLNQVSNKRH